MGQCITKKIFCTEKIRAVSEFARVSQVNGEVSSCDLLLNRNVNISAIEIT